MAARETRRSCGFGDTCQTTRVERTQGSGPASARFGQATDPPRASHPRPCLPFSFTVTSRSMDSRVTPDSVEKVITQPRRPHSARGLGLLVLPFSTLGTFFFAFSRSFQPSLTSCAGIIYSDIGTSPLYVLNGIWPADGPAPPKEDVVGGIGAIVWALTLMPFLKYVSAPYLRFEDSRLNTRSRSSSACALVPGREREGVSPCSKGYILPPFTFSPPRNSITLILPFHSHEADR